MTLNRLGIVGLAAATLVGSTMLTVQSSEARGFGGYRGGYAGGFRGGFNRGGYGYRRGFNGAGIGLGLASGLAIGALASSYPYGGYYGNAGYYGAYNGGCYVQPQRVWGPYGWYVVNRQVCY